MPLLGVALLASAAVAFGSYVIGDQWARSQALSRYTAIKSALSPASFLMTTTVVDSVAELTETELLAVNADGLIIHSSMDLTGQTVSPAAAAPTPELNSLSVGGRSFQYRTFQRRSRTDEGDLRMVVLFDESQLRSTRLTAASLPLLTGISTVVLLTSVTYLLTARILKRLARLQSQVDRIAEGDFSIQVSSDTSDEIGLLGRAVTRMSHQLESMWQTLNRQQGQKLLHQVAGGLAHQLRNSLTGARMAVELHQRNCKTDDDSLGVALAQLEQTESHVRRMLLVASGKQEDDRPQTVDECFTDIRGTVDGTAKHLRVQLNWKLDPDLSNYLVSDGPTLHAAVTNLAINALEEANEVLIRVNNQFNDQQLRIEVVDNGEGPPEEVASELFEPFVTSKPEGLGLGLPLVMRAAQRLGGEIEWYREDTTTTFVLTIPVSCSHPLPSSSINDA